MNRCGDAMTIKKSLILSHIVVCIVPVLMTFFVFLSSFAGLYLYAISGNHVMAESSFQFHVISNIIRSTVFHGIKHEGKADDYRWIIEMVDPVQGYVALYQGDRLVYQYGNEKYVPKVADLRQKKVQAELDESDLHNTYSRTRMGNYEYLTKREINGKTYDLYVMAERPVGRSDVALEKALHKVNICIIISLLFFIVLISYLLSRFLVRRILAPLQALKQGAEAIQKGDLDVHISHGAQDEFKPSIDAFNLMSRKLKESLEEREADEERRKELIASISHDIRTPLTSIKAYVEGLLDHVADTPEKEERYLHVIQKKADVLERLIEQLSLLTKMDLGERALSMETIDLSRLMTEFLDDNQLNWGKRGAHFTLAIEKDIKVSGNPLLLERIIENLVNNSLRYKVEDQVNIEVVLQKRENQVVLEIGDDGPGVSEEDLPRLQEAFYRTDKARSQTEKGSGLGLAIVRRAAAIMGGDVTIENRKPHGLMVRVVMPVISGH